ncbi:hypothetical protein E4K10_20670 [Streptomyces sp. T1317-0309]|nr:hypothetical protein E4K10_20670 [Streptomyces sp. T1317-0309]
MGITTQLSPDNDVTQLISGVDTLVKDGKVYKDPTGTPPSGANPETAVGITKDGKHAIVVAIDGHGGASTAFGVTADQAAGYMVAHGAYTAMLFDGGGSTGMVSRAPGADQAEVVTRLPTCPATPSARSPTASSSTPPQGGRTGRQGSGERRQDGHHRRRRFHPAPGALRRPVRQSGGRPGPRPDRAVEPRHVRGRQAHPAPLRYRPHHRLQRQGLHLREARGRQQARVPHGLARQADLDNGATQQLALSGTVKGGGEVQIPAEAADWKVTPDNLAPSTPTVCSRADADNGGLAEVSAQVAGATGTTSIAVGSVSKVIDPMTSLDVWRLSHNTTGKPATRLATDPGVVPPGSTESGSLRRSTTRCRPAPASSSSRRLAAHHPEDRHQQRPGPTASACGSRVTATASSSPRSTSASTAPPRRSTRRT